MFKKFIDRITNWELWPFALIYFPISFVWVWYMLKSRSVWFFTPSNPTITFGGFEGEGKREMYEQLPGHTVPLTIYIQPHWSFEEVKQKMEVSGFRYPFVVKPDVGMKGILFRKIDREDQLRKYHDKIPVEYLIQELIDLPVEVSVFYYRHPASEKGVISGFISKELLHVKGDGRSNLKELIRNHPRASHRMEEMQHRHGHRFERVLEPDQIFYLSYAGNHNRGAHFSNLQSEIDEQLHAVFDQLSLHSQHFYYGRYDIKAASIQDLKEGRNFYILEYNGCGAEPNHIYDCQMSLIEAYKEILKHWKMLYEISRHNHLKGHRYWSFKRGYAFLKASNRHFKKLKQYD